MATTDISKVGSIIKVTVGTNQPLCFVGKTPKFSFNSAADTLYLSFGNTNSFNILLTDLRVAGSGTAPASAAAAITALATSIFP